MLDLRRQKLDLAARNAKERAEQAAIDDLRNQNWDIEKAISAGRPAEEVVPLIEHHNKTRDIWASKYPNIDQFYPRLDPVLEKGLFGDKPLWGNQKVLGTKPGAPTERPKASQAVAPKEPPKLFKGASFTGKFDGRGFPIYLHPEKGEVALPWP